MRFFLTDGFAAAADVGFVFSPLFVSFVFTRVLLASAEAGWAYVSALELAVLVLAFILMMQALNKTISNNPQSSII